MHSKTLVTMSITAIVACMPITSEARVDKRGLAACAEAMTEQLSSAQGAPVEYRLNTQRPARALRTRNAGVWHLDAKHPETKEVVARVDCRVDSRARVTQLMVVPVTANDALERALEE